MKCASVDVEESITMREESGELYVTVIIRSQMQCVDAFFVLGIKADGVLPTIGRLDDVHHDMMLVGVRRQPHRIDAAHPILVGIKGLILEHQVDDVSTGL